MRLGVRRVASKYVRSSPLRFCQELWEQARVDAVYGHDGSFRCSGTGRDGSVRGRTCRLGLQTRALPEPKKFSFQSRALVVQGSGTP